MPVTDVTTDPEALTMTLTAEFDAPVERLWAVHTDPRQLERFWGPPGWPAVFTAFDLTPGGIATYEMTSPQGEKSNGRWEFIAIDAPHRLEVLDGFANDQGDLLEGMPTMRMVFDFSATETGSRMVNTTSFTTAEALEQVISFGAVEGSTMAVNQLDAVLHDLRDFYGGKGTRHEIIDDTHVTFTRLIDGPQALVWRAHHEPELLRQWQHGPDGWNLTRCEISAEVGGSYLFRWEPDEGIEGEAFAFEGEMLLSEPIRRAVTTERMVGMEGPGTINDLTLYEEDGVTLLTLLIEYPSKELRDMILATGMVDGMEASYARLAALASS